jgi:transposase
MQFIGCDVSKNTLDLAYQNPTTGRWTQPCQVGNHRRGFRALIRWAERHCTVPRSDICIVMEATGVYHLIAAAYLFIAGLKVTVVNPGRAAQYAKSQNQFNKSDGLDSRSLQAYGSQLKNIHWFVPASKLINQLTALLKRLRQLDKDLQREQNRLEKCAFLADSSVLSQSIKRHIKVLTKEQARIQCEIDRLINSDLQLQRNQQLMCSIKGIGKGTSQWLLPLLHEGRFNSARELAAFLGLVPCHKSSGISLHTPGRLSGRGDAHLRAQLYMPALSASTHNPELSAFYQDLLARGKLPKQALTAVMRKLVHLCYGVVKNQTPYVENYAH